MYDSVGLCQARFFICAQSPPLVAVSRVKSLMKSGHTPDFEPRILAQNMPHAGVVFAAAPEKKNLFHIKMMATQ
jgi:hypothetical protein